MLAFHNLLIEISEIQHLHDRNLSFTNRLNSANILLSEIFLFFAFMGLCMMKPVCGGNH